ncbi:glycosyltransferase [Winogradskyella aurantiaca]|uniref:glycosyltransferase n=1 Tax=Winogradskyella aurantiaca TaxID=2219558 RepID=UPI000E1D3D15|nr:glycosyltransferase family A protein [Winogradskyella aurantiaca]
MKVAIIIPAHNEADFICQTLDSLIEQTITPYQLIVVNDNSSDETGNLVLEYCSQHTWIELVDIESSNDHLPGSKIINAFNEGFKLVKQDYDFICKFDADLIFPKNYLEKLMSHFDGHHKLGMASGFCYIEKKGTWVLENLTRKDHIRGALKCYRRACFEEIGGLKPAMGWDTVDELIASYYGWEILTDDSLKVKHLKPTGHTYNKAAKLLQGEAMYRMRYGLGITAISGLKLALKKQKPRLFMDYLQGYFKAKRIKQEPLVTKDQGAFIRQKRWKGIFQKLF